MAAIDRMVANIRYKAQIMARSNKLESGIMSSGIVGFSAGVLVAVVLIVAPAFIVGAI